MIVTDKYVPSLQLNDFDDFTSFMTVCRRELFYCDIGDQKQDEKEKVCSSLVC